MNATPARILVVDDEPQIHRFLGPALSAAGYEPIRAESGHDALRQAATRNPALVLLDLGLPDLDGQALLPRLRSFCAAPVIIVSARGDEAGKVAALDAGAEDYVEKPFALAELLARIRVVLRRGTAPDASVEEGPLEIGALTIDMQRRIARIGEQEPLHLTPREWKLLTTLARSAGRVMTQRQLLTTVWGPAHADDAQYLRVYIGHLRQKLGPVAGLLRTEPGVGYRFGEADS